MSWNRLARPLLFSLNAESAHYTAMNSFATAARNPISGPILKRSFAFSDPGLQVRLFDLDFENPVGLAAGFDKNAQWFDVLPIIGFGHIEVGTITGQGQSGNPKPRLFRLKQDDALLNRMGFNNGGCEVAARAMQRRKKNSVVGINIGKTRVVELDDAEEDYLKSFSALHSYADYVTVNVSSPNTPGLRELQSRDRLQGLLKALEARNLELATSTGGKRLPILLKIAPDLLPGNLREVIEISLETGIAGMIATNTTISRDGLKTPSTALDSIGAGGISGKPLTEVSREFVRTIFKQTNGRLPVIGVGGIMNGEDAWRMICAGASLVQTYSGFVYGGPGFVKSLNKHLAAEVKRNGLNSIQEAVGRDV